MGKLYVVGIGPGNYEQMTIEAVKVLERCQIIVGYTVYVELVKEYFQQAKYLTTPMRQEVQRCHLAFEEAEKGNDVAMICSGDSGIYGMAGLIYEVGEAFPKIPIKIIPGITAASAGAAALGAPLMHDFAMISLSDLLTKWEMIERRLEAAASADLSVCIYNPSSKKRKDYLQRACDILLKHKNEQTVCACIRNIGREEESMQYMTLAQLRERQVDMFTTVFIGNTQTKLVSGKMVTPRGYKDV